MPDSNSVESIWEEDSTRWDGMRPSGQTSANYNVRYCFF
jgi:hypothetical protein